LTGLYFCNRRYYDPNLQRWLNRDPITESGGINLYNYCGNNPISLYDPFGLCWWDWYDNLAKWAQGNNTLSKDYLNAALPPWLATVFDTADDVGTQLLSLPSQIGHLGEATGRNGYIGDEPLFQPIANLGMGSGVFSADPSLANLAGVFQDMSTFLVTAAPAFSSQVAASESVGTRMATQLEFDFAKADLSGSLSQWTLNAENEAVDLSLRYKPGWTPEQRAAADAKIAFLNESDLVVSEVERSGTSASSRYKRNGGNVPVGSDVDHIVDLQLGGKDVLSNMWPLDSSVNRSLGSQIQWRITNLPVGTRIGTITIGY
jgi:hypothetical protein